MKKLSEEELNKYCLLENSVDYRNQMAEEKLRKIKLVNDTAELDLRKKEESVCYITVAMKAFEDAIGDIFARIKNSPEQLTSLLKLEPRQAEQLNDYIDDILTDLSNLDIQLESTASSDAKLFSTQKSKKEKLSKPVE